MKKILVLLLILAVLGSACAKAETAENSPLLSVTDGEITKTYTAVDLQRLEQATAEDKGVVYLGVPLSSLLLDAGFDLAAVSSVQAVASDGFSANYTAEVIVQVNPLLAYARQNSPLASDESPFRMVAAGQGGKLNPRMVVELRVAHP